MSRTEEERFDAHQDAVDKADAIIDSASLEKYGPCVVDDVEPDELLALAAHVLCDRFKSRGGSTRTGMTLARLCDEVVSAVSDELTEAIELEAAEQLEADREAERESRADAERERWAERYYETCATCEERRKAEDLNDPRVEARTSTPNPLPRRDR